MDFCLPPRDTVELSRRAIAKYERDKEIRRQHRLRLSIELNDPSLGPGMW
jgi:hypothetical protein